VKSTEGARASEGTKPSVFKNFEDSEKTSESNKDGDGINSPDTLRGADCGSGSEKVKSIEGNKNEEGMKPLVFKKFGDSAKASEIAKGGDGTNS
jgi:hypothetical protein